MLALVLGLIISAGLYFAYLWPSVEPADPAEPADPDSPASEDPPATGPTAVARPVTAAADDAASPAP